MGEKHNLDEGATMVDKGTGELEDVGKTEKEDLDKGLECNQVENGGLNYNNEEYGGVNENEGTIMMEDIMGEKDNLDEGLNCNNKKYEGPNYGSESGVMDVNFEDSKDDMGMTEDLPISEQGVPEEDVNED